MNVKNAAWYGGNISPYLLPGFGQAFYLNTAARGALDTNTGLDVDNAFLTLDHAIAQCSGTTEDYIFVVGHDDATETYPVEMDVARVHVIGAPGTGLLPRFRAVGNVDAFDVTATGCEIAGLNINTTAQGDTNNLVHCAADGTALWFHHNWVAWNWWGYDGLTFDGGGYAASDAVIENNLFGAHGCSNYLLYCSPQTGRLVIRNNVFMVIGYQTGVRALQLTSVNQLVVLDNQFKVPDLAAGEAITVTGDTNMFSGNSVSSGKVAMAFNPYRDLGDGVDNCWGLNYADIAPTLPVTV